MLLPARGDRVASYVIVGEIGRGGMATVFEAEHAELKKRVAIKVLHPHLVAEEAAASRFLREGKAAAQIHHPHVVDVFDVGTHEGLPYIVMERLDGVDLAKVVAERGALPLEELADLLLPVMAAVHAAHEAGVIHRDLKPSNVVVTTSPDGARTATVLDFGISKVTRDPSADETASEVLLGTVHYLSPEQTKSPKNASFASDQYALGVMLYECATGAKPFHGTSHYGLMHAIVSSSPVPPSQLAPSLPRAFDALVARAMHRDRERRFPSVKALGAALCAFASPPSAARWRRELGEPRPEEADRGAPTPPPLESDASAEPPRGRRAWIGAAVVALALALLGAGAALRPRAPPSPSTPSPPPPAPSPAAIAPAVATADLAPAVVAREEDAGRASAVASATTSAPPARRSERASPRAPAPSASAAPERGTNGAFIVE
jgi:serine/threonine-protein kinase